MEQDLTITHSSSVRSQRIDMRLAVASARCRAPKKPKNCTDLANIAENIA